MIVYLIRASCSRLVKLAGSIALASTLAAPLAAGQCLPDSFEPNDTCAGPVGISAGAHAGLTLPAGGADFYRIQVPAGHRLEVRVHLLQADPGFFGLFELVRDDGSAVPCDVPSAKIAFAFLELGKTDFLLAWSANATAATTFVVSLESIVGACVAYDLDLSMVPEPCASLPADAFENNDTCGSAAPLSVGSFANLNVAIADPDYFSVSFAAGELVTLTLSGLGSGEVVDVYAWESGASCGDLNQLAVGTAIYGPSAGSLFLFNPSPNPTSLIATIAPRPNQGTQTGFCVSYALSVTSEIDPCGAATGDAFEPNTDCSSAPLLAGPQSGLSITQWLDQDWYTVDVPPHSTLRLLTTSIHPTVERPMHLYDGCNGNPDFLMSSHRIYFDADPRQLLQWTNASSASVDTRLLVIRPVGPLFCDVYDLDHEVTLGTPLCLATRNSTGEAARLSASGSTVPGVGALTMSATPVPPGTLGLLIMSLNTHAPTPFGNGYLCLGPQIVRFPATTTGTGTLLTTLDWTGPSAQIQLGQSWSFQGWFRDPHAGGANFNVSEGLRVDFQ